MKKIYAVYADYQGEAESEVFGVCTTMELAKKRLESAVNDLYVNNIEGDDDQEFKSFEEYWKKGISEDGTRFIENSLYYGVPATFYISEVPLDEDPEAKPEPERKPRRVLFGESACSYYEDVFDGDSDNLEEVEAFLDTCSDTYDLFAEDMTDEEYNAFLAGCAFSSGWEEYMAI